MLPATRRATPGDDCRLLQKNSSVAPLLPPAVPVESGAPSVSRDPARSIAGANDNPDSDQPRPTTAEIANRLLNFSASVPLLPGKRYFVHFSVGAERRHMGRLKEDGHTQPTRQAIAYLLLAVVVTSQAMFGLLCTAYLLKSMLGLNLMAGPSPLHDLYQLFLARSV